MRPAASYLRLTCLELVVCKTETLQIQPVELLHDP